MNEQKTVLITGAGRGIGYELTCLFLNLGYEVFAISKSEGQGQLKDVQSKFLNKLHIFIFDVSDEKERHSFLDVIPVGRKIKFLVHNAATIKPVDDLLNINLDDWRYIWKVNVEAPMFLTKALLPHLRNSRILNISSGFAHLVTRGVGCYSITKNAMFKIFEFLREELLEKKILIGSMMPGVVDTDMQTFLRSLDEQSFPQVEIYRTLKEKNKLLSPKQVAECIMFLLERVSDSEYSEKDWSIKEILNMMKSSI